MIFLIYKQIASPVSTFHEQHWQCVDESDFSMELANMESTPLI